MGLLSTYKSTLAPTHGWNVELTCSHCAFQGMPRYESWMSNVAVEIGNKPTIYARLACPGCGRRLTDEAGKKLTELFQDIPVPGKNQRIITEFIAGLFLVPLLFALVIGLGTWRGWWGYSAFVILFLSALFMQPLVMVMNYRIGLLRRQCACGRPDYLFLGLLGRTYCYRCSSCGRLLRLRD